MLNIEHLDACYGESRVITDLSLEVSDKRIVCLIGRNGVGKAPR